MKYFIVLRLPLDYESQIPEDTEDPNYWQAIENIKQSTSIESQPMGMIPYESIGEGDDYQLVDNDLNYFTWLRQRKLEPIQIPETDHTVLVKFDVEKDNLETEPDEWVNEYETCMHNLTDNVESFLEELNNFTNLNDIEFTEPTFEELTEI
jgi:hypothetical protein